MTSMPYNSFIEQNNFEKKLEFLTASNIGEIDFAILSQYGNQNLLLNAMMPWQGKDAIIRNQIIKNNISSEQLIDHITKWTSTQIQNTQYTEEDNSRNLIVQKPSKLLSEYLLSLYQDNLLNIKDLEKIISDSKVEALLFDNSDILSETLLSIVQALKLDSKLYLLDELINKCCTENNDNNCTNMQIVHEMIISEANNLGANNFLDLYKDINSIVRLLGDAKALFNDETKLYLLKENKDVSLIENPVDMLQIAALKAELELMELLLRSSPKLLYAQNSDGVSLANLLLYYPAIFTEDAKQIIENNYLEDLSSEQNKALSYQLEISLMGITPKMIYKTTNPLFKLIKEDFVITEDFLRDNKTHILIAYDDGNWSNTFLKLGLILHQNFPEVVLHIINKDAWEKCDKNLLAKFDGFIIPASSDRYPSQSPFNLSDMGEEHFLPLNKLSINMLEFAQANNIPSIGSCGGAQATILVSGGSLMRLQERLITEKIEVEIKAGTLPYFMSLPQALQHSILQGKNDNYPKSIIIKADVHCGFVAVDDKLGNNVKLAGTTNDSNHYPMCYSNKLMFATQYHPEVSYIRAKYIDQLKGSQEHWIDSFINFAKIHHEFGGEYLATYVAKIEDNLHNLFGQNDEGEHLMGNSTMQDCAIAA